MTTVLHAKRKFLHRVIVLSIHPLMSHKYTKHCTRKTKIYSQMQITQ